MITLEFTDVQHQSIRSIEKLVLILKKSLKIEPTLGSKKRFLKKGHI